MLRYKNGTSTSGTKDVQQYDWFLDVLSGFAKWQSLVT